MSHTHTQAAPVPKEFEVLEETTPVYSATVEDEDGNALPVANIETMTLTYFTTKNGAIINSRDDQDVKNAANVTIDSAGLLAWSLQEEDTTIEDAVDTENNRETHRAIFDYTYPITTPTKRGRHVVDIIVVNLVTVP